LPAKEIYKAVAVLSCAAGDTLVDFWKLRSFGLADIEDIGAKSNKNGLILSADVLFGFLVFLTGESRSRVPKCGCHSLPF
jgi:hypothetical protein